MLAFAAARTYFCLMHDRPQNPSATPVTVVGLGAVGCALARALRQTGCRDLAIVGRGGRGERSTARRLGARYAESLSDIAQHPGYIILAVGDRNVAAVASKLARLPLPWRRIVVVHTSGVLGPEVLAPLAAKGTAVAACHPYQTFPVRGREVLLAGVTWGIDGNVRGVRAAFRLARALGGRPLRVPADKRVLYHLSAVFACGMVAASMEIAVRLLRRVGLSEKRALETVLPIAVDTLRNIAALGPRRAMTGPAVRGDTATIRKHVRALAEGDLGLADVYRHISRYLTKNQSQERP